MTEGAGARPSDPPCLARTCDAIHLRVRLSPGAAREGIEGLVERPPPAAPALAVRLRARPVEGAANAALLALLAVALGVPRSLVTIEKGATSRVKVVRVAGDPAGLAAAVARLVGAAD